MHFPVLTRPQAKIIQVQQGLIGSEKEGGKRNEEIEGLVSSSEACLYF